MTTRAFVEYAHARAPYDRIVPVLRSPDVLRAQSIARLVNAARIGTGAFSPVLFSFAFAAPLHRPEMVLIIYLASLAPMMLSAGTLMRELATHRALRRVPLVVVRAAIPFVLVSHFTSLFLEEANLIRAIVHFGFSLFATTFAMGAISLIAFSLLAPHFEALERPAQNTPAAASLIGAGLIAAPSVVTFPVLYQFFGALIANSFITAFGLIALGFVIQSMYEQLQARRDRSAMQRGAPVTFGADEMLGLEGDFPLHERDRAGTQKQPLETSEGSAYRTATILPIYTDRSTFPASGVAREARAPHA